MCDLFFYSNARAAAKVKRQAQIRNLWITNIAKTTRATELKQALSQYGKVIGAKVVTNARFPGSCCYGYVTMDTVADADRVIEKLSNTELNGQIIKIEKVTIFRISSFSYKNLNIFYLGTARSHEPIKIGKP